MKLSKLLLPCFLLVSAAPALASWNSMNLGFTWLGDNPPTEADYDGRLKGELYDYGRDPDGKRFTFSYIYKTGTKYTPKDAMAIRKTKARNPINAPDPRALFCEVLKGQLDGKRNLLKKVYKYPFALSAAHFYTNQNAATFIKLPFLTPDSESPDSFKSEIITDKEPDGVDTECMPTSGWIAIYRGNVIAPKDMTFRFLGAADDYLSVRFNGEQVLETGYVLPLYSKGNGDKDESNGLPTTSEYQNRILNGTENKHKDYILIKYKSTKNTNSVFGGVTGGTPITVKKGEVYPIEIIVANVAGEYYFYLMTLEATPDNYGKPMLFRTSQHSVAHSSTFRYSKEAGPQYDGGGNEDLWRIAPQENNKKDKATKKKTKTKFRKLK